MSYWEANCAVLREQYPGLLDEILKNELESGDLKVETAASGKPTLAIGGVYVHSPRDPEREGRRLAEASLTGIAAANNSADTHPGGSPAIILGFGLGYAAQALSELSPHMPIIIVEKNLSVLRKALELRDLRSLFSRPGVACIPGGNGEGVIDVLSFFEKTLGAKSAPRVIRNRTLTALDEQWYASIESRIRAWAMRDDVNRATLAKFGKRWIRNLSRNMSTIRDLPGIARLAGIAASEMPAASEIPAAHHAPLAPGVPVAQNVPLPVFLAAAGPGLDNVVHLLPEIRKRCIVVAVDTSLRFLLRNGIEPDFVVVVDPQFWNNRHLDRCASPRTRLVAESAVYPPVLRLNRLPIEARLLTEGFTEAYLCGSLFPLGAFIEQRVDPKGALGAGGSVATSAWDFCRILGPREIWIAGLDLAFPSLKTHFRGARFEEKALAESGRLNPTETWLVRALRDGGPFNAPSISGGQVLTDRRLSLYAAWFENRFRQFSTIRNYSIEGSGSGALGKAQHQAVFIEERQHSESPTEGHCMQQMRACFSKTSGRWGGGDAQPTQDGLAIAGLELAGAEALLVLPERRTEIDLRLETASSRIKTEFFDPEEARRRGDRYENAVNALHSGLNQIREACEKGAKTAEKALKYPPSPAEREKTLAALDKINRFITESEVKEIAGFLFPPEAAPSADANMSANADVSADADVAFRRYLESSARLYRSLAESATLP